MTTFKKLVLCTLGVATLSAGAVGTASADEMIVHVVNCYNVTQQFYNPYTGLYFNVWRRVCY